MTLGLKSCDQSPRQRGQGLEGCGHKSRDAWRPEAQPIPDSALTPGRGRLLRRPWRVPKGDLSAGRCRGCRAADEAPT